ncbi:hypothetical protein [Ponticoccus alexandrii]|uniref:Uncharacterized protein n=1 Tax=Ponticoccus alexandrii TaxID=1943633 RepID=A0ABX7FFN8_9RHOB|nr:hypothetical protein [Ponticoccus alexandrii]QRF69274.1 hypothetical protein GQA70_23335 [Ponticoccus alexandrii]
MVTQLEKGDTAIIDQIRSGALPSRPAAGLSEAKLAQVEAMLSAATHMKNAEETVVRVAGRLEGDLGDDARRADLVGIFDNRVADAIRAIPEQSAV